MSVLLIRHYPADPVLRQTAKRVHFITDSTRQIIDDMIETMQQVQGVGLAAPQVGIPLRIIVVQMPAEQPVILINPEILERAGLQEVTEGCLSVPGYFGQIQRSASVTVKGQDRHGKKIKIKAIGLMAEALQHEIDHLDGKLYIDHVENDTKLYKIKNPLGQEH